MDSYLGDAEATAAAIDRDGWLRTGDLGTMDERGYCRIAGRSKEMIIRGGENIYPREIEAVLLAHPGVAEVAVVGVPDRFWGEIVGAVVRRAPGQSLGSGPGTDLVRQSWPTTVESAWLGSRCRSAGGSPTRSRLPRPVRSVRTS